MAKIRARPAVSKQTTHRFNMKRLNLRNLNKVEDKETWETIRENIKMSAKESLGQHFLNFFEVGTTFISQNSSADHLTLTIFLQL
jgi:hypothetical protein